MKITRRQLRQLIEMAYKGHLGVIPSTTDPDFRKMSGGLDSTLYSLELPDHVVDGTEEDYNNFIQKYTEKQRRAAQAYAGSPHFNANAELQFGRLEADIWVLTKIGEFAELDVADREIIDNTLGYSEYAPLIGRVNFYDLNERSMSFLRDAAGNDSDILEKLGAVDANDTVIFHSTDGVGVKNDLIKNTPWLLFHAMIHNDEMLDSFRDWHHGLDTHQFDQPVRNFLTMSGAKGAKSFSNNTLSGDAYTEMIVQELLGKRNLVIRRDLLSPKDLKYVDERLIPAVKGFADMMREEIKGKLIVVRGT
jgi:hypothetical protein